MARTTYDLDEELVERVREIAGVATKKAAIEEALREFVNVRRRASLIARIGSDQDFDLTMEDLHKLRGRD